MTIIIIVTLDSCDMFIQRDHMTCTTLLVLQEMFFQRFWLVPQTDNGCFLALHKNCNLVVEKPNGTLESLHDLDERGLTKIGTYMYKNETI